MDCHRSEAPHRENCLRCAQSAVLCGSVIDPGTGFGTVPTPARMFVRKVRAGQMHGEGAEAVPLASATVRILEMAL
jgi:hypothetical protein